MGQLKWVLFFIAVFATVLVNGRPARQSRVSCFYQRSSYGRNLNARFFKKGLEFSLGKILALQFNIV